jgi:hypothetical protein
MIQQSCLPAKFGPNGIFINANGNLNGSYVNLPSSGVTSSMSACPAPQPPASPSTCSNFQ